MPLGVPSKNYYQNLVVCHVHFMFDCGLSGDFGDLW